MSDVLGFDAAQITSKANRSQPKSISPTLNEGGRMMAFNTAYMDRNGPLTQEEIAFPLDVASQPQLISSTEGSRANRSPWPASGPVLGTSVVSGLSFDGSCPNCGQPTQFSKMFPDFYPRVDVRPAGGQGFTSDAISDEEVRAIRALSAGSWANLEAVTRVTPSKQSSPTWSNSGLVESDGRYWTRNTSESRNAADACSLSQVLESEVSETYFLSARAAAGMLRRAERRGKELPTALRLALEELATGTETPGTATRGGIRLDLDNDTYIPDIEASVTAKWAKGSGGPAGDEIQETQSVVYRNGVRRLTPLECERLQGFPDGWTAGQSDSHRYRQMGNAVCVPVAEWIGHRLMAV